MRTTIAIESPREPGIGALLRQSARYAQSLYPPESNFLLGVDELELPAVSFYAARDESGLALGIAALVSQGDDTAELKRMFVDPGARGRGIARRLLARVEADALAGGIRRIVLETGPASDAALAFYRQCAYQEIAQFGQYVGEEFSVCFAKDLTAPGRPVSDLNRSGTR